jgi:protein TonB
VDGLKFRLPSTEKKDLASDIYSPDEIAEAAGVTLERVQAALESGQAIAFRGFVGEADAVRLVTRLAAGAELAGDDRSPMTLPTDRSRRVTPGLTLSGLCHAVALAALLFIASSSLFSDQDVKAADQPLANARLVFLMSPGPGGGGGGSGVKKPAPPPLARRPPPKPKLVAKISSPVPPVRRVVPPPPRPIERPTPPVEVPQAVVAPVIPAPADPVDVAGVLNARPDLSAPGGTGTGGAPGTGRGTGMGEGQGSGIGPGSGGGTGGGPYQPGNGIEPPRLLKEVRPVYTDEARRRTLEGDVVLEIVVTRSGSVDRVRVVRGLGAGLDQNAIAAVRQWRFDPARRQGAAVDVVVEVSVEFRLREY